MSGGRNEIINNFGPQDRSISKENARQIEAALKAMGPQSYAVVDYTGGTPEGHRYAQRLFEIFRTAGWNPVSTGPGWFQPVGGTPMIGVHFITHSDAIPPAMPKVSAVLSKNGIAVVDDYLKFPMFAPTDNVVGIAVGFPKR